MSETHVSTIVHELVSSVVGCVRAAAGWGAAQLGVPHPGVADLADERGPRPNWSVISVLATLVVYVGLLVVGWGAAAQWLLTAVIVVGSMTVALSVLTELEAEVDRMPRHTGFSDDPDELDEQLAELRPAVALRVSAELPVYAQCCASLGFNPLTGAGVR